MKSIPVRIGAIIVAPAIVLVALGFMVSSAMNPTSGNKPADAVRLTAPDPREAYARPAAHYQQAPPIDVSSLPVYPSSQVTQDTKTLKFKGQFLEYSADQNILTLRKFYSTALLEQGWLPKDPSEDLTVTDTSWADDTNRWYTYVWSDANGTLPYKLELNVVFNVTSPKTTLTRFTLSRIPNIAETPLYPEATRLETHYAPDLIHPTDVTDRVTTYEVKAQREEVLAYFKETWPERGWELEASHSDSFHVTFVYSSGLNPWTHYAGTVRISTEELAAGLTKVEVRAHGSGIIVPTPQAKDK